MRTGALMSNFTVDDDLLPTAVVAVRLDDKANKGWLVGRLNLEELWRMVDQIRVGSQGYALVVTSEGQLLAHGDPDEKSRVARGDKMSTHPLIATSAQGRGQTTASAEYSDARGTILGVAAPLPSLRWTIIVEQPESEAFAIPIGLQRQLVVAITLALLAMTCHDKGWFARDLGPERATAAVSCPAHGCLPPSTCPAGRGIAPRLPKCLSCVESC